MRPQIGEYTIENSLNYVTSSKDLFHKNMKYSLKEESQKTEEGPL
jgi:hypothetical protein